MKEVEIKFLGSALKPVEPNLRKVGLKDDENSVKDLLEKVSDTFKSELGTKVLEDDGRLSKYVLVIVNGVNITHIAGLDTEIKDGDKVSIVPAMIGG